MFIFLHALYAPCPPPCVAVMGREFPAHARHCCCRAFVNINHLKWRGEITQCWQEKHEVKETPTPSNHFTSGRLLNIFLEDQKEKWPHGAAADTFRHSRYAEVSSPTL